MRRRYVVPLGRHPRSVLGTRRRVESLAGYALTHPGHARYAIIRKREIGSHRHGFRTMPAALGAVGPLRGIPRRLGLVSDLAHGAAQLPLDACQRVAVRTWGERPARSDDRHD